MTSNTNSPVETPRRLRRVLSLGDLILYGIILVEPIAAVPLFGVAQQLSLGHAVTTILLAMIAMVLTAFSYGRMAALYPSAGSAYTYVGRGLNLHLGFIAGWAMFLDYLLVPILCTIYASVTIHRLMPQIPYLAWAAIFAALITLVNLRGIRATTGVNLVLMIVMCVVILAFIWLAIEFLFQHEEWSGLFSIKPFYTSTNFKWSAIATGTSVAALTYGGFDGITTLAEDVKNPRRNILLATVIVCLFTGLFGGLQIYLAQRVWPNYRTFPNVDTAFMDVARVVGGSLLFEGIAAILVMASLGAALSAQAGVSRLLFGMGRDGVLPRRFLTYLDRKHNTPMFSILMVGILAFAGSTILNYERAAELINFGAFLAFMGVNLAAIRQLYWGRSGQGCRFLSDAFVPAIGFLFCLAIWLSLPLPAKIVGAIWLAAGIIYDAVKTKGFRQNPAIIPLDEP